MMPAETFGAVFRRNPRGRDQEPVMQMLIYKIINAWEQNADKRIGDSEWQPGMPAHKPF